MPLTREKSEAYVAILKEELLVAMGCTEPIAIAYAASILRSVLGKDPEKIAAKLSGNIIKNVKSVIVPATGGLHGIEAAIAAGIVAAVCGTCHHPQADQPQCPDHRRSRQNRPRAASRVVWQKRHHAVALYQW